jgi:CheY-like chemotaxis protein
MSKTLLLADDSVTIQKVVGISLASEDITLVTVDNGDDALVRAREIRPDAILADCVMPGRSGYDVCEAVQADPGLRHIPVLLLTGTFEAFDEARAERCGAAGHIAKPFEAQTLVDEVQRLFALAASRKAAPAAAARSGAPQQAPHAAAAPQPSRREPRLAAVAAPAPAASSESFDFFDEEIDDLLPAELAEEPSFATGDELDLDSSETAFAFGGSEPAEVAAVRRPDPPAEQTVMMVPEAPAPVWDGAEPEGELAGAGETIGEADLARLEPDASMSSPGRRALVTEDLVGLDGAPEPPRDASPLRIDDRDLAGATVLDPQGAEGFDVSASDLGDPFAVVPPEPSRDPGVSDARLDPDEASASFRFDGGSLELLDPEPEPPPQPDFPEDRELVIPEPPPRAGRDAEVAALARNALEAVGPRLRSQLHETLEKVAWESLGDVTEQIVRHAVERIEAIAWEVIPQMAETLIREEIRRMKGEDGT